MDTISRLAGLMPPEVSERIWALADTLCEVRVRAGRPVELRCVDSSGEWVGRSVSGESLNRWLSARLMLHPRYDSSVVMEGDTHAKLQFRELLSIGFAHKFH